VEIPPFVQHLPGLPGRETRSRVESKLDDKIEIWMINLILDVVCLRAVRSFNAPRFQYRAVCWRQTAR
jgi:hypothetical protein